MHNGDVLGDEGRKALNACIKVKIYGKPETRKYDWDTASRRLKDCYAGDLPLGFPLTLDDECGRRMDRRYDIVDIHDALVNYDERKCVERYPKEGPGSDKLSDLIDKRRADVERELEDATADPDSQCRYSWVVAQRRVRDCFAGIFAEDRWQLTERENQEKGYNIIEIYKLFIDWDDKRKMADARRSAVARECTRDVVDPVDPTCKFTWPDFFQLDDFSRTDAVTQVLECYYYASPLNGLKSEEIVPVKIGNKGLPNVEKGYSIFDVRDALVQFDGRKLLQKYPEKGPGSEELKKLIDEHRKNLKKEYKKARSDIRTGRYSEPSLCKYSSSEAECRVRNCFAGVCLGDTEIFPIVNKLSDQTYDIVDINNAIASFDARTFVDACKYESEGKPSYGVTKQKVDEQRASIQQEYELATTNVEIEHGSGFIVSDHFIITNKHVIETYLNEPESHEIYISNAAIGELACKVTHYDPGKDLALLHCPDLDLGQSGVCPLQLSSQSLLPGMSIFCFGYPMSHTGETALFVSGNVSGSKKTLAGHSMVILNCALNSGNSGGPVLCWVKGQLRVVGVATQKHFKEILTLEERGTIEHIRKSLETHAISDVPEFVGKKRSFTDHYSAPHNQRTPISLLTLKLYDALETHSQFNLSNALPGHLVFEFIKKYTEEYKEELGQIVLRSC